MVKVSFSLVKTLQQNQQKTNVEQKVFIFHSLRYSPKGGGRCQKPVNLVSISYWLASENYNNG